MLHKRKENLVGLEKKYNFWSAIKNNDLVGIDETFERMNEKYQQQELTNAALRVSDVPPSIYALLIEKGLYPNAPDDKWNMRPLHEAVSEDKIEIVRLLLEAGADKNAKNEDGKTAFDYVKSERVRALLEQW